MPKIFKKLAVVLVTSMSTIKACKKDYTFPTAKNTFLLNILLLKCMPYIYYLIWFEKNQVNIQVPLDFDSKINAINNIYMASLDLKV